MESPSRSGLYVSDIFTCLVQLGTTVISSESKNATNVLNCMYMYLISFKAIVFSGVYVSTINCNLTTLNGKEQTKLNV